MSKTREQIEDDMLSVQTHKEFLDFCESRGGQLDQRLDNVACAFGSGELHFDEEDDVTGDLVVITQRGSNLGVHHYQDGEQIRDAGLFLEDVSVDAEGNLHGDLGELSSF